MLMTAAQMIDERATLWGQAKKILDTADQEKRNLKSDEREQYDKIEAQIDKLAADIDTAERRERASRIDAEMRATRGRRTDPVLTHAPKGGDTGEAFRSWVSRPAASVMPLTADALSNLTDCGINPNQRNISIPLRATKRAMSVGSPTAGGNLVTWHDFADALDRALLAYGNALALVKRMPTGNGITLPIPTIDDTANKAVIVAEAGAIVTNADPATGVVNLGAWKYTSKGIIVSLELLQDGLIDLNTYIPDLLGERFGRAVNEHIVIGTGSGQPFGIFPRATASGVVVGGTVASPTFTGDNFIDLLHSVDPAYRMAAGAGFMLHDTIVQRVRKLKDNNGQYLWQVSIQAGQPDRLAGYPLHVNQACPTLAANAKLAAFGDYKRYTWREVAAIDVFRLDELYMMNGQIGFAGLMRADGNLINTAAVKTLAAPAS